MKRLSFPKSKRLISNEQFKAVLERKLSVSDGFLILYMAENDCGQVRLGISVGKSCGGAVVRNRLKRLLREVFRQSQGKIPAGFDYVVMISPQWLEKKKESVGVKAAVKQLKFEQVEESFLALVGRLKGKIAIK